MAADFCSYQSIALELIKTKQRKETRFQIFMQVCPSPGLFLAPGAPLVSPDPTSGGFHPLPSTLGSRKQSTVPAPAAQGLDHLRNAAPDQVPAAAGEHHQAHRGYGLWGAPGACPQGCWAACSHLQHVLGLAGDDRFLPWGSCLSVAIQSAIPERCGGRTAFPAQREGPGGILGGWENLPLVCRELWAGGGLCPL